MESIVSIGGCAARRGPIRAVILTETSASARRRADQLARVGYPLDWVHAADPEAYRTALAADPDLILADTTLGWLSPEAALDPLEGRPIPLLLRGRSDPGGRWGKANRDRVFRCPDRGDLAAAVEKALAAAVTPAPPARQGLPDVGEEVLDHLMEGIAREDADGRLLFVNRAAAEMLGYAPEDLIGQHRSLIVPPDQDARVEQANQRRRRGEADRYELELLHRDGHRVPTLVSGSPVVRDGGYQGSLAVFTDISEQKRAQDDLRRSKESFQRLIQVSPIPVVVIDPQANVRLWNPAAERVFGWEESEVIGRPLPFVPPDSRPEFERLLERGSRGEWLDGLEIVRLRKDGTPRNIRLSTAPMHTPDGDFEGILGILVDITETKQTEAALRESEQKFRTLAEESPNMIFINRRGRVLYANKTAAEVMGYGRHEFAAPDFDFRCLIAPESLEPALANFQRHLRGEEVPPTLYTLIARDGRRVEGIHNTRLVDYEGEMAILGIVTDVTDARRAERDLAESEERYRRLVENAPDIIFRYRLVPEPCFEFISPSVETITGYPPEAFYTDPDLGLRILHEDDLPSLQARFASSEPMEGLVTLRWRHRNGTIVWTDTALVRVPAEDGTLGAVEGVARDVSDRHRAEQALARRAAQLEVLAEIGAHITAVTGLDELLERTAGLVQERLGYEHVGVFLRSADGGLVQKAKAGPYAEHFSEGHRLAPEEGLVGASASLGQPVLANDVDDDPRYVNHYPDRVHTRAELCVPIRSGTETVGVLDVQSRTVGAFTEIDVQVLGTLGAQLGAALSNAGLVDALRQSEQRYRALTENSAIGIYRTTPDGEVLFANPAVARMLGFGSVEDFMQRNLETEGIRAEYPRSAFKEQMEREGQIVGLESAWRRRDGGTIFVRESAHLVRKEDGTPWFYEGTIEDITERRQAEQALERHAQELQTLYESSLDTIAQKDLNTLLNAVVRRAAALIGSNQGGLYLLNPEAETLTLVVSHNYVRDFTGTVLRVGEGVSGRVAQTGEVMALEDYQGYRGKAAAFRNIETRRLLAVPLQVGDRIVGVLNVADDRVGPFSEEEIHLVHLFADQAALAVENARLLEAERLRTQELERARGLVEALSAVASEAEHAEDPREVMEVLGRQLRSMNLNGWIALVEPESGDLLLRYASVDVGALTRVAEMIGQQVYGFRIRRSASFVFSELLEARRSTTIPSRTLLQTVAPHLSDGVIDALLRVLRIETDMLTLCLPLAVEDRVLGGLFVWGEGLAARDLPAFSIFAGQIAGVMEKARLLEETRLRASYLEGITSVSTSLRTAATRADMLPIILDRLLVLLKAEAAAIERLGPQAGEVSTELGRGAWRRWTHKIWPAADGIRGTVLGERRLVATDVAGAVPSFRNEPAIEGLAAVVCLPLIVQDEVMGLMWVGRREPLSESESRTLSAVSDMAANALHRAGVMETLEERVRVRTRELEAANARLTELDKLKGEFVSNVSHELRTPITNIQLYLDLLRKPANDARRGEYLGTLDGQARRLGRLIEDLLAISRLDAGMVRLNLEAHLLDGVIAEVVQAHQARAEAKNISLVHEPRADCPPAWIGREQMTQVLTNLLANAIAYTPVGGRVVVGTICGRPEERIVAARVWNDGPPIPAEDEPHLFERFFRGQTGRASGEPGTGLGLAICQEIVERHHGRIEVHSAEGEGTTFTVWLPASRG